MTTRPVAGLLAQAREILARRETGELVALWAGMAALQAEIMAALVELRPQCRVEAARATAAAAGQATGAVLRSSCLTMGAAAKASGINVHTLREAGRRGELALVHVGRYVYVRKETLERWIETRERGR